MSYNIINTYKFLINKIRLWPKSIGKWRFQNQLSSKWYKENNGWYFAELYEVGICSEQI